MTMKKTIFVSEKVIEDDLKSRMFIQSRKDSLAKLKATSEITAGAGMGRPKSAAPIFFRQSNGVGNNNINKSHTVTPGRIRPKSAALLERAKSKGISLHEKALIVQEMLGSKVSLLFAFYAVFLCHC